MEKQGLQEMGKTLILLQSHIIFWQQYRYKNFF